MESTAALVPRFFVISSVILIIVGVAQVLVRPRRERETLPERLINRATITAVITVSFGILGLLIGLGWLPMLRLPPQVFNFGETNTRFLGRNDSAAL